MSISGFISFSYAHYYLPSQCSEASCLPGDEGTCLSCSYLRVAACWKDEGRGASPTLGTPYQEHPPQGIRFPTGTTSLPPAGDSHPVTPPSGTTAPGSSPVSAAQSRARGMGHQNSPVARQPSLRHCSSLNLALMLLAASLPGPDSWAHLPFQHWHPPNPLPGLAAVQNWGIFFSRSLGDVSAFGCSPPHPAAAEVSQELPTLPAKLAAAQESGEVTSRSFC